MEKGRGYKAHVVVVVSLGQGHVNPILQFSKRLASKGIKITMATTLSNAKTIQTGTSGSVSAESIYDDYTEGGMLGVGAYKGFLERFQATGSRNLVEFIKKSENSLYPVVCVVYDANVTWALDVAKQLGVTAAVFYTQSCAAAAKYYSMHLKEPDPTVPCCLIGLPELALPNLPSLHSGNGEYFPVMENIFNQVRSFEKADWVLINSFDHLEEEVLKWIANAWPTLRTVGPVVPSIYLDKRVEDDTDYGFNLYNANINTCMEWLSTKGTGSVVYVSFGSHASMTAEQMAEMACALKQTSNNFLWVVKTSEENNLPSDFVEETTASQKGLVLTWCLQLEVLESSAVGCFVSHCGWNSTVEALSFGVPMVGIPQFLDQMVNAYFMEQVWGVGVRTDVDASGLATGDEIDRCINEVMHGERGLEIKKKAKQWKEFAKKAVDEGGSSDKHIDEFVSKLVA